MRIKGIIAAALCTLTFACPLTAGAVAGLDKTDGELFDGNSQQFNDAIGVIQRMSNIDQVQQFVTDVLQLDSSNDIVKEFIRLINLSFKK